MLLSTGLRLWFVCYCIPTSHQILWRWLCFLLCWWGWIPMVGGRHLWWYDCWHIDNLGKVWDRLYPSCLQRRTKKLVVNLRVGFFLIAGFLPKGPLLLFVLWELVEKLFLPFVWKSHPSLFHGHMLWRGEINVLLLQKIWWHILYISLEGMSLVVCWLLPVWLLWLSFVCSGWIPFPFSWTCLG